MKTLEEARELLFKTFQPVDPPISETVSVPDAVGRVLAEAVFAKLSSPGFHAAAMDGIAVMAENTFGASESRPKQLIIGKDAFYVNTGHVLPENANAVIMIEHVQIIGENQVQIEAPVFPWQHVRKMGEDIVATELLVSPESPDHALQHRRPAFRRDFFCPGPEKTKSTDHSHRIGAGGLAQSADRSPEARPGS